MDFSQLELCEPLLKAIQKAGYESPSPIQEQAIPPVLAGRDLLGCAQTGTGKTAAFALPILQRLSAKPAARKNAIRALVLTPTRELALQIYENFEQYGKYLSLRPAVIFGGVGQQPQVDKLKKGVDILVATPGRLNDLIGQGYIKLGDLEIFVLDEADRMLDMGFVNDVKKVIKQLPQKRQTLLFSATMPDEIVKLANSLLHKPAKVFVTPVSSTVDTIDQCVYKVDKAGKRHLLALLLKDPAVHSALVFTRTKHGADRVARDLARAGIPAAAIHGNKSQGARQTALANFKKGKVKALVATDIAARGIDIHELSHVFNFDIPNIPETYVHRIGRTGRAGHEGVAVSFCMPDEEPYLKDIQKLIGFAVPVVETPPLPAAKAAAPSGAAGGQKAPRQPAGVAPRQNPAAAKAAPRPAATPKPAAKPQGGRGRGKGRQQGPRPPFDPYENLTGGSAIVTRKPAWGQEEKAPPQAPTPKGEDSMARNRRRGGRGRKKNPAKAGDKPGMPTIPKNEKGLFDFSESELAEDTSIKVVSRRANTETKYASYEDFLKDQGGEPEQES